jgi:hypothetical protein
VKTLKDIYKAHYVKQKRVMTKAPATPPHLMLKREAELRKLKYDVEHCCHFELPIYYLDEASFTTKDYSKYSWSNVGQNILIDFQRAPPAVSCSAIINEKGLVNRYIRTGAIKTDDHHTLLRT